MKEFGGATAVTSSLCGLIRVFEAHRGAVLSVSIGTRWRSLTRPPLSLTQHTGGPTRTVRETFQTLNHRQQEQHH